MSPKKYAQRLESLFTEAGSEAADTPATPSAGGNVLARFFDMAADGFVVTEAGGTITHVNAAFARLTGLAQADVVGQPFFGLLHPDDRPDPTAWRPDDPVYEFVARTRTATAAWIRLDWDAHLDAGGQGYFTARPAHEREVLTTLSQLPLGDSALETLRLLQRAIEAGDESVSIADVRQPDTPLVYINRAFENITGYTAAEVVGRNCRFLQGQDRQQPALDELRAALREGRSCTVTLRNYRKDGTLFYNRLEMSPVRDEHGVVTHFLGLQNDVTAEVRARQELERRNRELSALNAITRAVASGVSVQTLLNTAGQAMIDLFGVSAGYIALYDAERGLIQFPFYVDEGQQLDLAPRSLGQGLTSIVIRQREALLVNELNEETFVRLGALKIQTSGKGVPQSWLGVPMFDNDRVIGVLNVQDMPPQRFGPEEVTLLTTIAAALSSALQKTRLTEEAQLYADVMTNTPIGLYVWHLEDPATPHSLRLLAANPASREATGVDPAVVLGKTIGEAFPNLIGTGIPELYANIALGGTPTHLGEIIYADENIGESVFDVRAFPLPGQRTGVSFENITLSKRASEEFARLSAQQRAIVDNAGYALIGTDPQGTVTLLNPAAADLLGYDPAEVVGKHTPALWHDPLEVQARAAALTAELGQDVPVGFETFVIKTRLNLPNDYEWTFICKDGRRVPVLLNISAMRSEQGEIIGFVGIAADLTERKRAEAALTQSQQQLKRMAENVPGMVYQFVLRPDTSGYFAFVSHWVQTELGLNPDDLRQDGMALFALIHPDDAAAFQNAVFVSAQQQTVFRAEARLRRPDGSYLNTQWQSIPERLPDGSVMWNGVLIDITDRKQAEQALQVSEARFRLTIELTNQLIYDYDVPNDQLTWAGAIQQLTQFTPAEFATVDLKRWEELIHPDDRAAVMHEFEQAMTAVRDYRVEYRFERKDGSYFHVHDYGVFLPGPDGRAIRMVGTMSDITVRKQSEADNARRVRDLARVADISAAITANQEVQAVAETATRLTQRAFGLYHCHLFLFDDATQELGIAACGWEAGDPNEGTHGTARIPLSREQSLVALAARTQQAVIVNDTQNDPNFMPNALLPRTRAEMAVPMLVGGRLVGIFDVQADTVNAFDEIDRFIYTTLAAQVAASIQEARFFAEVSKRALELETVARVSTAIASTLDPQTMLQEVVDLTKRAFNLYHAHIYLLNASGDKLVLTAGAGEVGRTMVAQGRVIAVESQRSLVARAARTRQGVIRNDARNDPNFLPNPLLPETRSEMAVPMIVGNDLLGVFDVQADIVNRFNENDVRIKTTLAAQVAVALQNARRYEATRQRAERERLINEIAQKIQTAVTVPGALQVAAQELARITRAQHVRAELTSPDSPVAGD